MTDFIRCRELLCKFSSRIKDPQRWVYNSDPVSCNLCLPVTVDDLMFEIDELKDKNNEVTLKVDGLE